MLFFFCVCSNLKPPAAFSSDSGGLLHNKTKAKQQSRSLNQSGSQQGGTRRQENLRWASELSFTEGSYHWQEQVSQLQRQLDYSTSMCQTLLQDQQVSALGTYMHRCWNALWLKFVSSVWIKTAVNKWKAFFLCLTCFHRHYHTCYKLCWQVSTACCPTTCHHHRFSSSCTSYTSATPSWPGNRTISRGDNSNFNMYFSLYVYEVQKLHDVTFLSD